MLQYVALYALDGATVHRFTRGDPVPINIATELRSTFKLAIHLHNTTSSIIVTTAVK